MSDKRYVKIDGRLARLADVKKGDVFTLFEPDGTMVGTYIASSDAKVTVDVLEA